MLVESVAFFLAVSILFYCLFAGADFGAGILEAFLGDSESDEQRKVIAHAMGRCGRPTTSGSSSQWSFFLPGFPKRYSALSITFHIPLTLMLLGIILRGCAFTFRHYDAVQRPFAALLFGDLYYFELPHPFHAGHGSRRHAA